MEQMARKAVIEPVSTAWNDRRRTKLESDEKGKKRSSESSYAKDRLLKAHFFDSTNSDLIFLRFKI